MPREALQQYLYGQDDDSRGGQYCICGRRCGDVDGQDLSKGRIDEYARRRQLFMP